MSSYARHLRSTPQSEPILGSSQKPNSAGGFGWEVDCWTRLDRFLILGCEGGSYYASERKLTVQNAACVLECSRQDAKRTADRIASISESGRAPKNDPAIFALAMLAVRRYEFPDASTEALAVLNRVCRTGEHLLQFVSIVTELRGWGRGLRQAVARWYTDRPAENLAMQVTKYFNRHGWTQRDVIRLAHPWSEKAQPILEYLAHPESFKHGFNPDAAFDGQRLLAAVETAKVATTAKEIVFLIREGGLVREHVPTKWLNDPSVWEALLEKMPMTAMVRNLGKMTSIGLLKPLSSASKLVSERLVDAEKLKRARVHPMALLIAQRVYATGRGDKGSLTWQPVNTIVDALDEGFYQAFDSVQPTGKRYLLALDISGSMNVRINGSLTAREASAAMALVTARTEKEHHIVGFTAGTRRSMHPGYPTGLKPLAITPRQRLAEATEATSRLPLGGTDCALPMLYAMEQKLDVDAFVLYTDSETWHGDVHPSQALQRYRQASGIPAKLIVCAMTSNGFTIADPADRGMLDIVGFDAAAPVVMADFITN